jgi:hypothetical protein
LISHYDRYLYAGVNLPPSGKRQNLEKEIQIVKNLSTRPGVISAILCVLVFSVGACTRRGLNHDTSDTDFDCDSTCEAQVRVLAMSAGRLQVTEAQWQAAFASGKHSLAHDAEYVALIAEMKEQVCQRPFDQQKFLDWNTRMSKKMGDDLYKDGIVGNAILPGDSPKVNEARARVAKIQIIRYMEKRDRQSCPAPAPHD